jgi:hypothetical protein
MWAVDRPTILSWRLAVARSCLAISPKERPQPVHVQFGRAEAYRDISKNLELILDPPVGHVISTLLER